MDEEIKKYELEKIKLEVTKLEKEIYEKKSTDVRGWLAIIITIISIGGGFFGLYTSFKELKDQYEEEKKFSFKADMLDIIKEGDGEKLNLQSLIYFGHNPIPLLISIMEYDAVNREDAVKVILRIYGKQSEDIKSNIRELLVDSFEVLGSETEDYQAFFAYFKIFDELGEGLGTSLSTRVVNRIKTLDYSEAVQSGKGKKIEMESLISFEYDAIPLLIPIMQYDLVNRQGAIDVILTIYGSQSEDIKLDIEELLIESYLKMNVARKQYTTFFAYFGTFSALKNEFSSEQKARILKKAEDLDATIPLLDFNFLDEKGRISNFINDFKS